MRIDGVFDIETSNWDTYQLGALHDVNGTRVFRDPNDLFDAILGFTSGDDKTPVLWAHNGGRYDALWFLEHARRREIRCSIACSGSAVTRVLVADSVEIRDSARLFPMSLATLSKWGGVEKSELDKEVFPCSCGDACGGYCSISPKMSPRQWKELESYLRVDCLSLWTALHQARADAEKWGILLRGTIGNSAWQTARAELGLPSATWSSAVYARMRDAYSGGRCQVARPRATKAHGYDINSAYPAALSRIDLPLGEPRLLQGSAAARAFRSGVIGFYDAEVEVNRNTFAPPLWWRAPGRICYPIGRFDGRWPGLELAHAEDHGAKIRRVDVGIVFMKQGPRIKPFVDRIWDLRAEMIRLYTKKDPRALWLKLVANSFTGKCAQQPLITDVKTGLTKKEIRACPGVGSCRRGCSGLCGSHKSLDARGWAWSRDSFRIADCAHVEWAAYLTAATRVELHRGILEAGDGWVYSDTDSVKALGILGRDIRVGKELGEWADEGEISDWECVAPKAYRYRDGEGKWEVRLKGVSEADHDTFTAFEAGETIVSRRGVKTFKTAMRGQKGEEANLFQRKEIKRTNRADGEWFGDRLLDGDVTRPVEIGMFVKQTRQTSFLF